MTSQEANVVVQKALDVMRDISDEFDVDDPKNKSFLAMVEGNNRDSLAFLAMSDIKDESKEDNSKDTILSLMARLDVENDNAHKKL